MMVGFKKMTNILKDRENENFKLEKFTVRNNDIFAMRAGIPSGDYIRLIDKHKSMFDNVVMSDTPMEHRTNQEILEKAHGDILIGGLGIGMILIPLLEKEDVKSITVVEKYQDIIDLVLPQLPENKKLKVINGDIFENTFPRGTKFDIIYFDIWNYINSDVYEEMKHLKKKYKRCLKSKKDNPNSWMKCWCEYEAKNDINI